MLDARSVCSNKEHTLNVRSGCWMLRAYVELLKCLLNVSGVCWMLRMYVKRVHICWMPGAYVQCKEHMLNVRSLCWT